MGSRIGSSGSRSALFVEFGGNHACGTDDTVANYHHGYGGTSHDFGRCGACFGRIFGRVQADIAVNKRIDFGHGDADQQDGFVVFQHFCTADGTFFVQCDNRVNRFAGIAARIDHVGGDIRHADFFVAFVNFRRHRFAFWRAETGGVREDVGGFDAVNQFGQTFGMRGQEGQKRKQQNEAVNKTLHGALHDGGVH